MHKIFCSYARGDAEFALKLAKELRSAGAELWVDQLDISPGERWDQAVEKALHTSEHMLVILSPLAVDSPNVMDEVAFALEEKKHLIPVIYRECKVPFRLRRIQYIDLSTNYSE